MSDETKRIRMRSMSPVSTSRYGVHKAICRDAIREALAHSDPKTRQAMLEKICHDAFIDGWNTCSGSVEVQLARMRSEEAACRAELKELRHEFEVALMRIAQLEESGR